MAKREVTDELVARMSIKIPVKMMRFFLECKNRYGTVSPVLTSPNHTIPHPVHFREGMQVRNMMRSLDMCKDWTDHDFDETWTSVVDKILEYDAPIYGSLL